MATNYPCTGTVTTVWLSPFGSINVSTASIAAPMVPSVPQLNFGGICQIGATANGWSSDACKALYSQLLIARSTGAPITFWFNDSLSCTTQPFFNYMPGLYGVSQ
jgi:hypothetical protein